MQYSYQIIKTFFISANLNSLSFGQRFGTCNHLVKDLLNKERDGEDFLQSSLVSDVPCGTCKNTLESYMECIAASKIWPASAWLCYCGTMISGLSQACPCPQPSRKTAIAQQGLFILRQVYSRRQDLPITEGNNKPFSLNNLLLTLYHEDHLEHINRWLKEVNGGEANVTLDNASLRELSPPPTWICHQVDNKNCLCPLPLSQPSSPSPLPTQGSNPGASSNPHLEEISDYDSDSLEIHPAKDDLMDYTSSEESEYSDYSDTDISETQSCAGASTAHLSPPHLRSMTFNLKEKRAQLSESLPSGLGLKNKYENVKLQTENQITSISKNIKDRLGPSIDKNTSSLKFTKDPDAVPNFYRGRYPAILNPHNIRLTQVLPSELTGQGSGARFMQELYCIELTQFYRENSPNASFGAPYMVPEIFGNMRKDQLAARKCWLMKTYLENRSLSPQIYVHADRSLSPHEIGLNRIPLQVIVSESAHLIPPDLPYFKQISELIRLKNLASKPDIKRKASGPPPNPTRPKIPYLMDLYIPSPDVSPSINISAGTSKTLPPPTNPRPSVRRATPVNTPVGAITTNKRECKVEARTTSKFKAVAKQDQPAEYFSPLANPPTETVKTIRHKVLSQAMSQVVDRVSRVTSMNQVMTSHHHITIKMEDLRRLLEPRFLNDKIVNIYLKMIEDRSFSLSRHIVAFDTLFYPQLLQCGYKGVRTWNKINLFDPHRKFTILIPIHHPANKHWTLVSVNIRKKTILYLDSLGGSDPVCLKAIQGFLKDEFLHTTGKPLDIQNWSCKFPVGLPTQENSYDCGMFILKYSELISRGAPYNFSEQDLPLLRKRMVYEIMKNHVIPT